MKFETLEDRRMLALGSFERTDGDVDAAVDLFVEIFGGTYGYDGDYDADNGIPDETFATVSAEIDPTLTYLDSSADAEIALGVALAGPDGVTKNIVHALVSTGFKADVVNGGTSYTEGSGTAEGYFDVIEVPEEPFFIGSWLLRSTGQFDETEEGIVEVDTTHYVEITTIDNDPGGQTNTWFISAVAVEHQDENGQRIHTHAQWMVDYHLPDRPDPNEPFLVSGGLYLAFTNVRWQYDGSDVIRIVSNLEADSQALGGGTSSSANYEWGARSWTSLHIVSDLDWDSTVPGGIINPLPEIEPPKVSNVTISSTVANSYGTNPAYSFDSVDGSEEQLRTVPVGGANKIAIQFTKDVDIVQGDLDFIALNRVVTEPGISGFVEPGIANNYTATWTLASALPAAQYLLRLSDSIEDADGNALDGEWTNPGSINSDVTTTIFPSGDNVAGGDFEFGFTYLTGDADRTNQVTLNDYNIVNNNFSGTSKTWGQGDFSGNGVVDLNDFNTVNNHFGFDWRNLAILGDYDGDFDLESDDETDFLAYYGAQNAAADLTKNGVVDQADYDAFYELLGFGINLRVLL